MSFTIRGAEPRDLPDLKRMRIALQNLLAEVDPKVWRLAADFAATLDKFYGTIIAKDENRIFVAADGTERPVGMLMVRIIDNPHMDPRPFGRIDDAWVEPAWRRRGVMGALTAAGARFLVERSVPMVMLDWANNNPPSGTCWQSLGFEPLMTMGFTSPTAILSRKEQRE